MSNKHVSNRNILITQEDDWFMAKDIETNVASQGDDINSALANLKETLELYYEDCVMEEISTKVAFLTTYGIGDTMSSKYPILTVRMSSSFQIILKLQGNFTQHFATSWNRHRNFF